MLLVLKPTAVDLSRELLSFIVEDGTTFMPPIVVLCIILACGENALVMRCTLAALIDRLNLLLILWAELLLW